MSLNLPVLYCSALIKKFAHFLNSYIRKPFLIYDFAPDSSRISLYEENFVLFLSVCKLY